MAHSHGNINHPQQTVGLAFFIRRGPRGQLALHFTDYQRSSPLYRQLICQASYSNCSPSPCSRFSLPQTTTGTPPAYRSSGPHSLIISIDLPQSTCRTQTYWLGCRLQSLPLLAASRYRRHDLAMFSSWHPACRLTFTTDLFCILVIPITCTGFIRSSDLPNAMS